MKLLLQRKDYILKMFTDKMMSGIPFEITQVGVKGEWGIEMK